jgi:hypothetical protein
MEIDFYIAMFMMFTGVLTSILFKEWEFYELLFGVIGVFILLEWMIRTDFITREKQQLKNLGEK